MQATLASNVSPTQQVATGKSLTGTWSSFDVGEVVQGNAGVVDGGGGQGIMACRKDQVEIQGLQDVQGS